MKMKFDSMRSAVPGDRPSIRARFPYVVRAKASLVGGVVAAVSTPVFWFVLVLLQPSGFWTSPSEVIWAAPAIWLFAGLITAPAGLCFGPVALAFAAYTPLKLQHSAFAVGALLGAGIMYTTLVVVDNPYLAPPPLGLVTFGGTTGAFGAWVAALYLRRWQTQTLRENVA
ncbi:MAG: hypothetical protein LW847_06540 [Burkholderiales bacterium]|jgi:hypothetical protein|nr:hypothetical protein [Burkholderiales bacterium]